MLTTVDLHNIVMAAAEGGGNSGGGGGQDLWGSLLSLAPIVLIVVVFFWLMNRSQRKKQEQREDMLSSLQRGDRVVTIGGIYGKIVEIRDESFVLRVNDEKDIKITVSRNGISGKQEDEESD